MPRPGKCAALKGRDAVAYRMGQGGLRTSLSNSSFTPTWSSGASYSRWSGGGAFPASIDTAHS